MSPANKIDSEKLFIALILFAGLAMAYLLGSSIDTSTVVQPTVVREVSPELASVNLDLTVLDNILFKQLKVFGVIPVNPGQTGRENPFLPF